MATEPLTDPADEVEAPSAAQKRIRSEAIQRLQVGLSGLAAILLLVSLASVIINRANQSQQTAVPDTTASADDAATPNKDPLVDAGVVPQMPAGLDTAAPDSPAANRAAAGSR